MMDVIKQHFINVNMIEGGWQINLGYAGVLSIVLIIIAARKLLRKKV